LGGEIVLNGFANLHGINVGQSKGHGDAIGDDDQQ
jgi:hypothetical protein